MINRRDFVKMSAMSTLYAVASVKGMTKIPYHDKGRLRLGGPIFKEINNDPDERIKAHKELGYSAAYCPLDGDTPDDLIKKIVDAAEKADLIIAEVGAWSNPISTNDEQRKESIAYCIQQLVLADKIGASCCVNIAGSREPKTGKGPHQDNLTSETFDLIVETTRRIIDAVKPKRTYFALETMPYIFPNSVDSYLALMKKIDRKEFAVHLDPVNLINSVDRYYSNSAIIKEAFNKLGKYIKSCHGKDIIIGDGFPVQIDETQPGLGYLDYKTYLTELSKLDNVPLMLEHLEEPQEYKAAGNYVASVAKENNIDIKKL